MTPPACHVGWSLAAPHAYRLLLAVVFMNVGLLVFNLLPIYPLDGGILWFALGPARSLKIVAALGLLGAAAGISVTSEAVRPRTTVRTVGTVKYGA